LRLNLRLIGISIKKGNEKWEGTAHECEYIHATTQYDPSPQSIGNVVIHAHEPATAAQPIHAARLNWQRKRKDVLNLKLNLLSARGKEKEYNHHHRGTGIRESRVGEREKDLIKAAMTSSSVF